MKETGVAERYARALFLALGETKGGSLDAARKGLAQVYRAVTSDPKLKGDLQNPLIPLEQKKTLMRQKTGIEKTSPILRHFLDLLLVKKRTDLLPMILARFEQTVEESQGVMKAFVKSAAPLDQASELEIEKKLSSILGRKILLETSVHPEILAGIVVKAGDKVFDNSLESQLKKLKDSLTF